jgi:hypothetical protein
MRMRMRPPTPSGIAIGAVVVLVLTAGTATAAKLITSADIKNNTITSGDIKDNTIKGADIKNNQVGSADLKDNNVTSGDIKNGTIAPGDLSAAAKDSLTPAWAGPEWSVIDRNVIGNGDSYMRSGPSTPPLGVGSLGLRTGSPDDAAAFGNQSPDSPYFQMPVSELTQVGFWAYTTGENNAKGNNMPAIKIEINPNVEGVASTFTTMVYLPDNGVAGQWTPYDAVADSGAHWGLTGTAFNTTVCSVNGARCTFQELMDYLDDGGTAATIITVQVGKGRDFAYSGAVDSLVINDTTYDFEPFGTIATATTETTLQN